MKRFLHIICTQFLVCLAISTFAQTTVTYTSPGTTQWTPPAGVTSISLQMWGGGGAGQSDAGSGGGGAFLQTTSIPVQFGKNYNIIVGAGAFTNPGGASSFGETGGSIIVSVAGGTLINGGPASTGNFVQQSFHGGNGLAADFFNLAGGGAGAGTCGPGADGTASAGGAGTCGGGSGGNLSDQNGQGFAPGGGGAGGGFFFNAYGANGKVILTFTCSTGDPGQIGNPHTITYPPEMIPDNITNIISPTLADGVTIGWQQSTDNVNFVTAKTPNTTNTYRFDKDNLQATTYYKRGSNACLADPSTFGNWSNIIQIKVFTSENGRNGQISGFVQTRNGAPISGRKVYAQSLTPLKGRPVDFLDSALTDQQGKFNIDTVFYGDKNNGDSANVRFKIYADTAGNHGYEPANAEITLSTLHPSYDLSNQPFRDTTEFSLTGRVVQVCKGCLNASNNTANITGGLDSVRILGIGKNNSPTNIERDSAITGWLDPPGAYGSYALHFKDADKYTVTPTFKNHKFAPKDSLVVLNGNVGDVNFTDTTTHLITGFFGAGCHDVIGTAVLEFGDSLPPGFDGKARASVFRKRVTTNADGSYSIRLPARAYKVKIISATISDPVDASTKVATVKSYFQALPTGSLYRDITTSDQVLDLIYQRPPQITVASGIGNPLAVKDCPTFKNYDFWPQAEKRGITFSVFQGPVSRGCLVDTGTVYLETDVSNSLGNYDHDTIELVDGVGLDSVIAAQPNTVINPGTGTYSKRFIATYTDIIGRSTSTNDQQPALPLIVVTGAAIDPSGKTFVTVSPQVPFLILHDPPGSASKATWTQNVTSEQAISFKAAKQNTEGGFINIKLGLSQIIGMFVELPVEFWAKIDAKFSTTNTTTNTTESVITNTTEQTIETSEDPAIFIGEGDLVYGAALNINYQIGTDIEWDSKTCQILGPKPVMVTDIKNDTTSFLYTVGHIKNELIPQLQQAAAAQTREDSIAYFENQIKVWEQLVTNNEENIAKAPILQNLSFSNGTSSTYTNTLENSATNSYDFDLEIDRELAISAGFEIAGTGLDGGYNVAFKMTTGSGTTTTNKKSTTTSYTLKDINLGGQHYEGNYYSVNVKKDPVYGTPMFETVAGGSQCPWEPGTIALDRPVLTANVQTLKNVKKDTATFKLFLNNLSADPTVDGARPYVLFLNAASNPSGATVLIGGSSDPNGVTYTIPNNGGVQQVTVSVIRNSASGVYNYDNLQFIMSDNCFASPVAEKFFSNPHQFSTLNISADFAAPVSGVNLVTPVNNWVANLASNNIVPVTFNGYDTSKLQSIAVQFNKPGTGNWANATTIAKAKLGKTSTTFNWNISKLADGPYNLRLQVKDKSANIVYSQVVAGIIDRIPPALFGTPQPANGVYIAGTQISCSYTENIVNTNLQNSMVQLQDMTAGTKVAFQLSAFNNTMIILPTANITGKTDHLFRVIAGGVSDLNGNVKTKADTSYFTVGTTKFSTGSDALKMTTTPSSIFEDATGRLNVRFTRSSKVTGPTLIYYNLCGNAVYNKDYTVSYNKGQTPATGINGSKGVIVMPKDSSVVNMYLHPVADTILTPNKVLNIILSEGGGYTLGSNYKVADTILNHNLPAPVVTADKPTTLCPGDSVTLSAPAKINGLTLKYLWSTGEKTRTIKVKKSGTYTVKVTDPNGFTSYSAPTIVTIVCSSPTGLKVKVLSKNSAVVSWAAANCPKRYVVHRRVVGKPNWISDTLKSNVLVDTIKGLTANTAYEWQVATICQYPSIIISAYTNGTNFTTPVSFSELSVTSASDYAEAKAGDGFAAAVYPNPASSSAGVQVKGIKGSYNIRVINMEGVTLWTARELTDSYIRLPLNGFAKGVYMVIVADKEHIARLKLMKQ